VENKISVIVCTYNQQDTIGRTLDSILMQRCHVPVEIVIGEDCSADGTLAVCRDYQQRFPDQIRIMANRPNKGFVDNYFDCMMACEGQYIADCSGDDFWMDPQKLEKELAVLEQHPDVGIVHTDWQYYDEATGRVTPSPKGQTMPPVMDGKELLIPILTQTNRPVIQLCTSLYRAEWARRAHDENLQFFRNKAYACEDIQLSFFLSRMGKVAWLPDVTLNYGWGGESISNSADSDRLFKFYSKSTQLCYDLAQHFDLMGDEMRAFLQQRGYAQWMHAFRAHDSEMVKMAKSQVTAWGVQPDTRQRLVRFVTSNPVTWNMALGLRKLFVMMKRISHILLFLLVLLAPQVAEAQMYKLSPMVKQTVLRQRQQGPRKVHGKQRESQLCAFVKTSDLQVLRDNGCKVLASFGDIHVTNIPESRIYELAKLPEVKRIEAGQPCSLMMDTAAVMVRANELWNYNEQNSTSKGIADGSVTGYTGKGVVVGVMDVCFDVTHPTFYTDDMQDYRIRAFWDMLDLTGGGQPFEGIDTTYVGRQYTDRASILEKGGSYDRMLGYHGTHTSSTAAGSGAPTFCKADEPLFRGIAPEADICLVSNATGGNIDSIPEQNRDLYTNATDVLGFKYLFDYAEQHNKPCVVSFSEGYFPDFYGQDILFQEALQSLLGPGRILVAAAGNEGYKYTYVDKPVGVDRAGAFISASSETAIYVYRSSKDITLRITFYPTGEKPISYDYSTKDLCQLPDSMAMDTVMVAGVEHVLYACNYPSCYNEKDWGAEMFVQRTDGEVVGKEIPVSIALLGREADAGIYAYGSTFKTHSSDPSLAQMDMTHNIHNPGGLEDVICVGAVNSRLSTTSLRGKRVAFNWGATDEWASFSSVGPSLGGRMKPDVMAPGNFIIAAGSHYTLDEAAYQDGVVRTFEYEGNTHCWRPNLGTSMSTPVVAGVIALWLQACPTLTTKQAMEAIAATSTHPEPQLTYPNYYYGYGTIDAVAGLEYIQQHFADGIEAIPSEPIKRDAIYDLQGRRVHRMLPGHLYIKNGKKVLQ